MVYIPPAFREQDLAALHAHIAAVGFATLITVGEGVAALMERPG